MFRSRKGWATGALIALLAATTGCEHNLGTFTFVATKNLNTTSFHTATAEKASPVQGEDVKLFGRSAIEEAVDKAIEPQKAQALTNARLVCGHFLFWDWSKAKGHAAKLQ